MGLNVQLINPVFVGALIRQDDVGALSLHITEHVALASPLQGNELRFASHFSLLCAMAGADSDHGCRGCK